MSHHNMSTLRRANSSAHATVLKQQRQQSNSFDLLREERTPPPPPAPQAHLAPRESNAGACALGSNSSTPRGSMEHLPPPPPHLLHSDEEDAALRLIQDGNEHESVIAQRGVSVAESIKALQKSGHLPCSPKSLRRAHSVTGAHSPFMQQQQQAVQEKIYAPVAQLQQKLQQRQQQQMQQQISKRSPEGEQYGFGVQFRQHQNQFFDQTGQQQQQQRQMSTSHDQIMGEVDANMRNRPKPPPMMHPSPQHSQQPQTFAPNQEFSSNYDVQTAMRVRKWIETRSVSDVRNCRPLLNAEIHQGLALRKTSSKNDRSAPRF